MLFFFCPKAFWLLYEVTGCTQMNYHYGYTRTSETGKFWHLLKQKQQDFMHSGIRIPNIFNVSSMSDLKTRNGASRCFIHGNYLMILFLAKAQVWIWSGKWMNPRLSRKYYYLCQSQGNQSLKHKLLTVLHTTELAPILMWSHILRFISTYNSLIYFNFLWNSGFTIPKRKANLFLAKDKKKKVALQSFLTWSNKLTIHWHSVPNN